ncbi:MAG TPA: PadR family transcriptional regulator [Thermoplasmata archaeon]|nr:PadR family transcriptional regulator [Thermoplasmata archaeon]
MAGSSGSPPPGLVGLYALAMMEKAGRVHGYGVADRIAERTDGSWRPGPGAVYPSLQKLVRRGLARRRVAGRRREYEITAEGRRLLRRIRQRQGSAGSSRLDLSVLWAEVVGTKDLDSFLLLRLRRSLDALGYRLERPGPSTSRDRALRDDVVRELATSLARLRRRGKDVP